MKQSIAIYLAGTIKKGHEKLDETFWTEEDIDFLKNRLSTYAVSFLNPALRSDDLSNSFSVFGRDMLQVFCSDFVFVDARDRRGLGVGAEMMWAKLNNIPVVTWAPKNSHYHKEQATILGVQVENFIHPFVEALSDRIVENLEEGVQWMSSIFTDPSMPIKGIEHIEQAMQYYKTNQLEFDQPMQALLKANPGILARIRPPLPIQV